MLRIVQDGQLGGTGSRVDRKNEKGLAFSKRGLPAQGSRGIEDPTHVSRMSHEGT